MNKFISQRLKDVKPYEWGLQPQDPDIIKLNTNENPYPPANAVAECLATIDSERLKKYPDPSGIKLVNAICVAYSVKQDEVFLGNGSDDILSHAFLAFYDARQRVLVPSISYSLYPVLAKLYRIELALVPLLPDFRLDIVAFSQNQAPILIANPNAPTGLFIDQATVEQILRANPDHLVILDEAYIDFAPHSMSHLIADYDNLLVIQTSSKSRSLAGLRLGWALGNPALIKALHDVRDCINPYNVDTIALEVGAASFQETDYFNSIIQRIIATRDQFTVELRHLGMQVLDSTTNFVLTAHPQIESKAVYDQLCAYSILVRYLDLETFGTFLRISIGTTEDMKQVIHALKQIIDRTLKEEK